MKFFNNLRNLLRSRLRKNVTGNEKGQGATEYIMLLVVIVGLIVVFKGKIMEQVKGNVDKLGGQMSKVTDE